MGGDQWSSVYFIVIQEDVIFVSEERFCLVFYFILRRDIIDLDSFIKI